MSMDEVNEAYSVGERAGRAAERAEIVAMLTKTMEGRMYSPTTHSDASLEWEEAIDLIEARGKEQSDD